MANLIETLLAENLISAEQLQDARDKQRGTKKPLQDLIVEMGFVKEKDVVRASSSIFELTSWNITEEDIDLSLKKIIPYVLAKRHGVFPIRMEENTLLLAMSDPGDVIAIDDIRAIVERPIKPVLCPGKDIHQLIEKHLQVDDSMCGLLKNSLPAAETKIIPPQKSASEVPTEFKMLIEEEGSIVQLVNLIIGDAVKERASDIHIEPREHFIEIRNRIDGDLKNILKIPIKFHRSIIARIKIISDLNIAEHVKPQDGRIHLSLKEKQVDLRVSTTPTYYGEKVVMRILDTQEAKTELNELGFDENEQNLFMEAIKSPKGMIFVTGPTGSGKTSTLYAALNQLKGEKVNIITIEDPIEYVNEGINQIQVNPVRKITFASGLRSILRQDPDVILIGEIRDQETAEIAVKASLTGHLVLSTLHTNSAVATITRLADMGIDYYQIASCVILIVSQRLVKLICSHCKTEFQPDKKYLDKFKDHIEKYQINKFFKGEGCAECNFKGYHGRTAVFEVLMVTEEIKTLISNEATEAELLKEAQISGLRPLLDSGISKVKKGLSTLEEVVSTLGSITKEESPSKDEKKVSTKPPEPPQEDSEERTKPRILIVDDEEDIRKIIGKYVEQAGYDVCKANNGLEAIEAAFREKPDLIIMDVMMPEMDGFEATKKLRSSLETAVIPIMMLTAKQDKESELEGIDVGADDYLTKPCDKEKLLARIKMLLRRRN